MNPGRPTAEPTYLNPVHHRAAPDPFVLKFCGEYWCYSTGFWRDGRCFGIMRSTDLVNWQEQAGAMDPLPEAHPEYWAPEVSFWQGRFYMYYSCGDGTLMHLRVAVSDYPSGPFLDSGRRLSDQQFAIDAHVFEDDDGSRYLFYATDFLEHTHVGTGTVMDRLVDPFTLAGNPRPVSRARYDWQVYDPHRLEKGGVRWHTVEGPFVLKFKGRYYQMYSGGNWQNTSYGVSYAVTPRIGTLDEWQQLEHTESRPLVLRTLPGQVTGPGHNSVVRGPDNLQLFCVYHRWASDGSGRLLAIDRLEWAGDRVSVLGPSTTLQPAPVPPTISGFTPWTSRRGDWLLSSRSARHASRETDGSATLEAPYGAFVLETSLRVEGSPESGGGAGMALADGGGRSLTVWLSDANATVIVGTGPESREHALEMPPIFSASHFHELRLEVDGTLVHVRLDGLVRWRGNIRLPAASIELVASAAEAVFESFALTAGWQELFMDQDADLAALGWRELDGAGAWEVRDNQLVCGGGSRSALVRDRKFESYEAVLNVKVDLARAGRGGALGIMPALTQDGRGPLFTVSAGEDGPVLEWRDLTGDIAGGAATIPVRRVLPLPSGTDLSRFLHFRFRKRRGRLSVALEAHELCEVGAPLRETAVGLLACGTPAACDSVRVTAFPPDGSPATAGKRG